MKKSIAVINSLVLVAAATLVAGADEEPDHKSQAKVATEDRESHISRDSIRLPLTDLVDDKIQINLRQQEEAARIAAEKAELEREKKAAEQAAAERARKQRELNRKRTQYKSSPPKVQYNYGSPKQYALNRLGRMQYQCFDSIVTRESGWNYRATNPSSGAYGLVQALPGYKMASAGADWQTNPITQIRWGITYMNSRYGSPCGAWSFWQANHWY